MKAEIIITRSLEIVFGVISLLALVITVIVFAPYLLPKSIIDWYKKLKVYYSEPENVNNTLWCSALVILFVFAYVFLTIISQP